MVRMPLKRTFIYDFLTFFVVVVCLLKQISINFTNLKCICLGTKTSVIMRAFPNQESFVKGNDCAVSRRPLCFQMDTFPSSDFGLVEQSALLSKNKKKQNKRLLSKK